jgi:general secretion pathway protein N
LSVANASTGQRHRRVPPVVLWFGAGLLTVALTILAACPASWMGLLLEKQTGGRLTLGDPQGSLWRGSAFIGGAPSGNEPVTALLPGRFDWQLSPLVLLGRVNLQLENPQALSQPVHITGSWRSWQVSPAMMTLPATRLAGLGAPLNTVEPSGVMQLSWGPLQIARRDAQVDLTGTIALDLQEIASRMSPVKPLGSYTVHMDWQGAQATLQLNTRQGPLLLNGNGAMRNGRLQFSGTAEAAAGQEDRLANLLNLLGQRRQIGARNVIALEFK